MSNHESDPHADRPLSSSETEVEAIAQETGASEEQVAQLARVTENGTDLQNAAAAAARWS